VIAEFRDFALRRGQFSIDDLLPASMIGWIFGIGVTFLGSCVIALISSIFYSVPFSLASIVIPTLFSVFMIVIGICAALPFVWLLHAVRLLNGLSVVLVGVLITSPLFWSFASDGSFLTPFAFLSAVVGVSTGAMVWHAVARYSNEAS
jgi:hypothetical protein